MWAIEAVMYSVDVCDWVLRRLGGRRGMWMVSVGGLVSLRCVVFGQDAMAGGEFETVGAWARASESKPRPRCRLWKAPLGAFALF